MKLKNTYKTYHIAAALVAAMFLFVRCNKQDLVTESTIFQNDTTLTPIIYAYNVRTLFSDSGYVKLRVTSKEYQIFKNDTISYMFFPRGLYGEGFDRYKQTESEITCKYAKYFQKKEFFELRDSVVAKNKEGEIFETDLLYWDRKTKKVYTDQYVKITRATNDTIEGIGFEANDDFSKWIIKQSNASFNVNLDE